MRKQYRKFNRDAGHKIIVLLFSMAMILSCAGNTNVSDKGVNVIVTSEKASEGPSGDQSLETSLWGMENINQIREYLPLIKRYSKIYGFDWRLILAVIQQESNFNHEAVSPKGAYGLLQLMPETGEEIVSTVSHIYDYKTPEQNIVAGMHYLWTQFNRFYSRGMDSLECLKLALASYNAGPGRILDAQYLALYLGRNPNEWESVQLALSLLSPEYYTLHRYVWETGRPRSGYFKNYKETINYVEKILNYYEKYKRLLK